MILPFHSNVFTHENRKRTSSQKLAPFVPLLESSFRERGFEGDKGQSQISEIKKEKERTKLGSAFRLSTLTLWTADVQLHRCTPVFPPRWQAMSGEHTLESRLAMWLCMPSDCCLEESGVRAENMPRPRYLPAHLPCVLVQIREWV